MSTTRPIRRTCASLCLFAAAGTALLGSTPGVAKTTPATRDTTPAIGEGTVGDPQMNSRPEPAAGSLHVVHPVAESPYLADSAGRMVLLRGVNVNSLVQYASDYQEEIPLQRSDFSEMAALGFNFVRLAVSWSRIEPHPGQFDNAYLSQVAQAVRWAGTAGMFVLLDMHQDRYNRHTWPNQEVDGAPDWATETDGVPCTPLGATTACAQVAEQNFWDDAVVDGKPLQSWYLGALVVLARTVGAVGGTIDTNLAGIELMNEPTPGAAPPGVFERSELYPFYRRMIAGLRAAGVRVPLWFEPSILRDLDDDAVAQAARFSSDRGLVYAVHIYTDVFSPPFNPNDPPAHLKVSYQNAALEAATFDTPWVDDEFGSDAGGVWDTWLGRQLALQAQYLAGSAFWIWKQRPGFYGWSVVQPDSSLRQNTMRAQLLSLPHVEAVPGRLVSTTADASRLTAVVTGPGGTVLLWAGTVVEAGGPTILQKPLATATVDGRLAPAQCQKITFNDSTVRLAGCLLRVTVPAGRHMVALASHPRR